MNTINFNKVGTNSFDQSNGTVLRDEVVTESEKALENEKDEQDLENEEDEQDLEYDFIELMKKAEIATEGPKNEVESVKINQEMLKAKYNLNNA